MKVLIIDNYDSFTYNLYQYIGELALQSHKRFTIDVIRNDAITANQIVQNHYNKIIISPGPGSPADSSYFGVSAQVITQVGKDTPVLGVCLGMQGIAYHFGGKVKKALVPMHGKTSEINHDGQGVFAAVPQNIQVMRYHSLVADRETLPECLTITATSNDTGEIMGLRHKKYPVEGVQFHPESFATLAGKAILSNFLY